MGRRNQRGQAVLIVLLSLSVVLVVVMYILSRSVTDISLSTKDENAMRAFSAAEAGIEKALVVGSSSDSDFSGATFDASVTDFAAGETQVVYPVSLKSGELATFWFVEHDTTSGNLICDAENPCFAGNQIKLCWGDSGTPYNSSTTPAIELTVYYVTTPLNLTTLNIKRAALDVYTTRAPSNNFTNATNASCTIAGEDFQFQRSLFLGTNATGLHLDIPNTTTQGTLLFATVKMLYNTSVSHKIGLSVVNSTSPLPSQGRLIDSTGSYFGANRKISVYQLHPAIPPIFTNAIFSGSGIIK